MTGQFLDRREIDPVVKQLSDKIPPKVVGREPENAV
jgi:hypothetical protein